MSYPDFRLSCSPPEFFSGLLLTVAFLYTVAQLCCVLLAAYLDVIKGCSITYGFFYVRALRGGAFKPFSPLHLQTSVPVTDRRVFGSDHLK